MVSTSVTEIARRGNPSAPLPGARGPSLAPRGGLRAPLFCVKAGGVWDGAPHAAMHRWVYAAARSPVLARAPPACKALAPTGR